jgi:YHS domain-containing protein
MRCFIDPPCRIVRAALLPAAMTLMCSLGAVAALGDGSLAETPVCSAAEAVPDQGNDTKDAGKDAAKDSGKGKPAGDAGKGKDGKDSEAEKKKSQGKTVSKRITLKVSDPYPLDVCAVDAAPLGTDAQSVSLNGRDFRFCSAKCVEKFTADPDAVIAALDARIIAAQGKNYPLSTCLIMEEEPLVLGETEDVVINNRLFRLCCGKCVKKLHADPEKYWAKLDAAVIAAQKPTYTLETCPVSGDKLGTRGEPVDVVVANRLIRLCCKGCEKELRQNAAAVLAKVK